MYLVLNVENLFGKDHQNQENIVVNVGQKEKDMQYLPTDIVYIMIKKFIELFMKSILAENYVVMK